MIALQNQRRLHAMRVEAERQRAMQEAVLELLSTAKIEANVELTDELLAKIHECAQKGEPLRLKVTNMKPGEDGRLLGSIVYGDE